MGYKNKTNKEYQIEYYAKNKLKRNQYYKRLFKEYQMNLKIYIYINIYRIFSLQYILYIL